MDSAPSQPLRRPWTLAALTLAGVLALGTAAVAWRAGYWATDGGSRAGGPASPARPAAEAIARGAYLATVGNCAGCHSARGREPWSGGRAIATPFGTVYSSNLTPHPGTGLGDWTADDFWRALHHGRSRDGRFLLPAFPFAQYTQVTRDDADDLFAYLRSLKAVDQPATPHTLRFPYNTTAAMAVWRALYFSPQTFKPEPARSAEWNRGAYLVEGLGHCAACHAERNALGATRDAAALGGGHIPMQGWYAPSLAADHEAGVAKWPAADVERLLQTGTTGQATVLGPMAEVVLNSTQHLNAADLRAMTQYLQALPPSSGSQPASPAAGESAAPAFLARGQAVYEEHCVACHGRSGEGAPSAYPPLAGNRALGMASAANVVKVVIDGGFAPATTSNPRPYGMPPYGQLLNDNDIAAVVSYVRQTWGNGAAAVSPLEVQRLR